jgi:hypothetical protein
MLKGNIKALEFFMPLSHLSLLPSSKRLSHRSTKHCFLFCGGIWTLLFLKLKAQAELDFIT